MSSGAGMGLLLIVVAPVIWALPIAFLTAELSSAIPEEGGYYIWVKRALGPGAGFLCTWLMLLYTRFDLAIYPVLFINYLKYYPFASALQDPLYAFLATMAMIIPLTWLNITGSRAVSHTSVLFSIMLLVPFIIMIAMGLHNFLDNPSKALHPFIPEGENIATAFSSGFYIVMWNYIGWDAMSTISGEVEKPQKIFPPAIFISLVMIFLSYFLPVLVGLSVLPDTSKWTEGSWPAIARLIGGDALADSIAFCGLVSCCGLFVTGMFTSSRIPVILANDNLVSPIYKKLHPRYGTPWVAIILSGVILSVMSLIKFDKLAEFDVIFYSLGLLIELAALLMLRIKEPDLIRPFKIPGGKIGLFMTIFFPVLLIMLVLFDMLHEKKIWAPAVMLAALLSGIVIWQFVKKKHYRGRW